MYRMMGIRLDSACRLWSDGHLLFQCGGGTREAGLKPPSTPVWIWTMMKDSHWQFASWTLRSYMLYLCVLSLLLPAAIAKRNPKPFFFTLFERPARKFANELNPLTPSTETLRRRQNIAFVPTPYDDVRDGGSSSSYFLPGPKLWNGRIRAPITDASYCGISYDCSYDLSSSRGIRWDLELVAGEPDVSRQFLCVLFDGEREYSCAFSVPSVGTTTTSSGIELPFAEFVASEGGSEERMRTESIRSIRLLYARTGMPRKRRKNGTFCVGEFRLKIHSLQTY